MWRRLPRTVARILPVGSRALRHRPRLGKPRERLAALNNALGGQPVSDRYADLDSLGSHLNAAFYHGHPQAWEARLVNGARP
jgi:hypothetical protein